VPRSRPSGPPCTARPASSPFSPESPSGPIVLGPQERGFPLTSSPKRASRARCDLRELLGPGSDFSRIPICCSCIQCTLRAWTAVDQRPHLATGQSPSAARRAVCGPADSNRLVSYGCTRRRKSAQSDTSRRDGALTRRRRSFIHTGQCVPPTTHVPPWG
jgi:hypothetical protein